MSVSSDDFAAYWQHAKEWTVDAWEQSSAWVMRMYAEYIGENQDLAALWESTRSFGEAVLIVGMVFVTGTLATCTAPAAPPPVPFMVAQSVGEFGFRSSTPYDFDALVDGSAPETVISGELVMPEGDGPFPAMVLLHGSGGIGSTVRHYADRLAENGIGAFMVDSFTARGVGSTAEDQIRVSEQSMIADAYAALELLASHPRLDETRIGVMGWSKGGTAAVYAASAPIAGWSQVGETRFAYHMGLYPFCNVSVADPATTGAPVQMLLGEADDYTPARHCLLLQKEWSAAGGEIDSITYAGAYHGFDNPLEPRLLPDVIKVVRDECRLLVGADGVTRSQLTGGDVSGLWSRIRYLQDCAESGAQWGGGDRANSIRQDALDLVMEALRAPEPALKPSPAPIVAPEPIEQPQSGGI